MTQAVSGLVKTSSQCHCHPLLPVKHGPCQSFALAPTWNLLERL
jgi:hypothetical protein